MRPACVLAILLTLFASLDARANDDPVPSTDVTVDPPTQGVYWHEDWPKVGVLEIAMGGAFVAGAALTRFLPEPPPARWKSPILLDRPLHNLLSVDTVTGRESVGMVSDYLWYASMAWPLVIDGFFVALIGHGNAEVAAQLMWISFETLALSAFLATASENIGRTRPRGQACLDDDDTSEYCESGEANRSFLSGHALASFAGAGLVCASHANIPLYGGGAADTAACAGALTLAGTTALLRLVSDNHWTTDVLISGGIGFAIGSLLPRIFHFGFGHTDANGRQAQVHLIPLVGGGITGLALDLPPI